MSETNMPSSNIGSMAFFFPEGVSGLGPVLWTPTLSAVYLYSRARCQLNTGLRTAGVVDITTRSDLFAPEGTVNLYGGSRGRHLRRASIMAEASALRSIFSPVGFFKAIWVLKIQRQVGTRSMMRPIKGSSLAMYRPFSVIRRV